MLTNPLTMSIVCPKFLNVHLFEFDLVILWPRSYPRAPRDYIAGEGVTTEPPPSLPKG